MSTPENAATEFLTQLYTLTKGDLSAQQSMHDVGAVIGLDKEQSGKVAEDLIGEGLVEIKTLSGGVGITAAGIEAMQASGAPSHDPAGYSLGSGRVMESDGRSTVEQLLKKIKLEIGQNPTPYAQLEEMIVDIKTIETQMLSPNPKVAIIRELFGSLQEALSSNGPNNLSNLLGKVSQR